MDTKPTAAPTTDPVAPPARPPALTVLRDLSRKPTAWLSAALAVNDPILKVLRYLRDAVAVGGDLQFVGDFIRWLWRMIPAGFVGENLGLIATGLGVLWLSALIVRQTRRPPPSAEEAPTRTEPEQPGPHQANEAERRLIQDINEPWRLHGEPAVYRLLNMFDMVVGVSPRLYWRRCLKEASDELRASADRVSQALAARRSYMEVRQRFREMYLAYAKVFEWLALMNQHGDNPVERSIFEPRFGSWYRSHLALYNALQAVMTNPDHSTFVNLSANIDLDAVRYLADNPGVPDGALPAEGETS